MFSDLPLLFLLSVAIISFSGVVMPGPVFATTLAQGYHDRSAGLRVTMGHALIEVPLIVLIFLGFDWLFADDTLFALVAGVGGALLVYMGVGMVRSRESMIKAEGAPHRPAWVDGALTTLSNPYWLLWWATIGAALVATAMDFGLLMLPVFILVHLSCDAGWLWFISHTVNRSKGIWDVKWHHLLIIVSGGIMALFGCYFLLSSTLSLL